MPSTINLTWDDPEFDDEFENFVGRADKINIFRENFNGERPRWMVLSITGEGGVGKTTLLNQFSRMARMNEIEANVIKCDDHQQTPVEVMAFIAEELAKLKITNREFDGRLSKYRQLREQAEKDPNVFRGLFDVGAHVITDVAVDAASRVPGLGSVGNASVKKAAGDAVADTGQYLFSRWSNKEEVQLLREPEKYMTPLFINLLNNGATEKRLVILFDVFERTGKSLSTWLLELFTFLFGKISTRVSFVLSGRDALDQHWTELGKRLVRLILEPFELKETREYLINRNIIDEKLIEQIHKDTGGLPVLIELLAATNPKPGQPLPDISKNAVDRFLYWTPKEMRKMAMLSAIPRQFNKEIFTALLGDEAESQFDWLIEQSYIRCESERGWFYHEKVRELMLRYQSHEAHSRLSRHHMLLADFFSRLQAGLNLEGKEAYGNKEWRQLELERVYHLLSAHPEKHYVDLLNAFLTSFLYRWPRRAIVRIAEQVLQESEYTDLKEEIDALGNLVTAHEENNYQQAICILGQLETHKNISSLAQAAIFYQRGDYYRQSKNYDEALININRSIALNDSISTVIATRGSIYQVQKRYDEALKDLNCAVDLDEKDVWIITSRGCLLSTVGNYDEALKDFKRALELDDKYLWALSQRSQTFRFMGKYDEALMDLNHAISIDDKYAAAYAYRGVTYARMGKNEEAIKDLSKAIDLDGKFSWALANRGMVYKNIGNNDAALTDLNRAVELDEKDVYVITFRGYFLTGLKKYPEALEDFNRALTLDSKYSWALAQRSQVYRFMEKYDDAFKDINLALELDGRNAAAYTHRGATYHQIGDYENAIKDFNKALELDDKFLWSITSRARTYRQMKKYDHALLDINRALELGDTSFGLRFNRALIFTKLGKLDDALSEMAIYMQCGHPDIEDFTLRALIYKLRGEEDDYLKDLETALSMPCEKHKDNYDRAIALIFAARITEAIAELGIAFESLVYRNLAKTDDFLDPIRDLPKFKALFEKYS
jgi:tetratricopeptide (TPR) repeat protein